MDKDIPENVFFVWKGVKNGGKNNKQECYRG